MEELEEEESLLEVRDRVVGCFFLLLALDLEESEELELEDDELEDELCLLFFFLR